MALPFLSAAAIPLALQDVVAANDNPQIAKHLDYVRQTWVDSTVWPPSTWSVFRQPVRTNNDVEGWHCRLNVKAHHSRLNMYQLIQLLHTESELVDVAVRMLSECGTTRLQKRAYSRVHTRFNKLWDEYCFHFTVKPYALVNGDAEIFVLCRPRGASIGFVYSLC